MNLERRKIWGNFENDFLSFRRSSNSLSGIKVRNQWFLLGWASWCAWHPGYPANSQRPYARSVVLVFKPTTWKSPLGKPRGLPWRPTRDVTTHHPTRWNKWRHVLPAATHSFLFHLTHHPPPKTHPILLSYPPARSPVSTGSPRQEVVQRDESRRG